MKSHVLNRLGAQVALTQLGFRKTWSSHYLRDPQGRQCIIRVQPQFGEDGSFSIEVNGKENFMTQLKTNTVIFVNYDKPGVVEFYECTDPASGKVEYVKGVAYVRGRDQTFTRLILRFDRTKTKLLHTINDQKLWLKFRANSMAQAHNLNSPHYAA